jgi:chorismate lyase/3-hydroxybenzoate synthase
MFFLSGTASIRGHKTMFVGDLQLQLNCTLENIDEILSEALNHTNRRIPKEKIKWRVYLRDPDTQNEIQSTILNKLGAQIEYLTADICRADLLIEIEGMAYGL